MFVWNDKDSCWEGGTPAKKPDANKAGDAPKTGDAGKDEEAPKPHKAPAAPAGDPAAPVG